MEKKPNSTKFTLKIVPFKNPGGSLAHRVTGRVLGCKVEKNFPTRERAEAFMDECLEHATQGKSAFVRRDARTCFANDAELRVAELAHKRLAEKKPGVSLLTVVDDYLARTVVVITDIPATQAIEDFAAVREKSGTQEISWKQSKLVLNTFIKRHKITMVSAMPAAAKAFVTADGICKRTQRDRYDLLTGFSKFLIHQKHLEASLTEGIARPKVTDEGDPTIFTLLQCQRLLDAAAKEPCSRRRIRGMMLPYIAICMLSGIRPDEAKRITWAHVSLENKVITGFRAKRSNRARSVAISDQLCEILQACKAAGLPMGYFSRKAFESIQRAAGVRVVIPAENSQSGKDEIESEWDNDILRHCYASYSYAALKNKGELIKNMGNSEDVIDASYLNLTVLEPDGVKFLAARPAGMSHLGTLAPRFQHPRASQLTGPVETADRVTAPTAVSPQAA